MRTGPTTSAAPGYEMPEEHPLEDGVDEDAHEEEDGDALHVSRTRAAAVLGVRPEEPHGGSAGRPARASAGPPSTRGSIATAGWKTKPQPPRPREPLRDVLEEPDREDVEAAVLPGGAQEPGTDTARTASVSTPRTSRRLGRFIRRLSEPDECPVRGPQRRLPEVEASRELDGLLSPLHGRDEVLRARSPPGDDLERFREGNVEGVHPFPLETRTAPANGRGDRRDEDRVTPVRELLDDECRDEAVARSRRGRASRRSRRSSPPSAG